MSIYFSLTDTIIANSHKLTSFILGVKDLTRMPGYDPMGEYELAFKEPGRARATGTSTGSTFRTMTWKSR